MRNWYATNILFNQIGSKMATHFWGIFLSEELVGQVEMLCVCGGGEGGGGSVN